MYPLNHNGDPMYVSQEYKRDSFGNELYEKTKEGNEVYLMINRKDIMAKRKNSNGELMPYFATDVGGHPICPYNPTIFHPLYLEMDIPYPKNTQNRELYPRRLGKEYYIGFHRNCKYARDQNNEQYYATLDLNDEYYAFKLNEKNEKIEYPRQNNRNEFVYIILNDMILYPKNLTLKYNIFPLDSKGNKTYLEKNGKQFYPFNSENIYVKNRNGDDILAMDQGIPYYGFKMRRNKKYEIYPKLKNKNDFYLTYNNLKLYAKTSVKDEYYAHISQGGEFFADKNGVKYYATNINNVEIYPRDKYNIQFYKNINDIEWIAIDKNTNNGFYAKDTNLNEFYPKKFILEKEEINREQNISILTMKDIISHNATSN